jgi:hypothetical protein
VPHSVNDNGQGPRKRASGVSRLVPTLLRITTPANPHSTKSRDINNVHELSTSKDRSDRAMEVAGSHLEESDLFDPYEAAPERAHERAHDMLLQRLLRAVNKGVAQL